MATYQEVSRQFCYEMTKRSMENLTKHINKTIKVNFVEQGNNKNKIGVLKSVDSFVDISFTDGDKLPFIDRNIIIRYITDDKDKFIYDKSDFVPKYYSMKGDLGKYRLYILGLDSITKNENKQAVQK